jgi:hypothetical protein
MQVPTAGVLVIPGTGLVITCSVGAGNFVQGDTYSFLTAPPGFSTSDITTNMTAIRAQRTYRLAIVHNGAQPNTAAGAISAGSTLETAIEAAFNSDGLDWQGVTEGPSQGGTAPWGGDIVVSGSNAIRDSADTDAVVVAARVGQDWPRTALHTAMHRITSPTTGRKMLRPSGWAYVGRAVAIDPSVDPARRVDGPLPIFQVGRDEDATPGLDDAQINAVQTERDNPGQAVASITSGGFGWKNLTTQANFQWAAGVRVLNMFIAGLRPIAKQYLGSDQVTNLDGTIEEKAARKIDGVVNTAARRRVGLESGGDFPPSNPQASSASASVLRSSQLGQSPHRLDIAYDLQSLGFVSDVQSTVNYSGVLSLS